MLSTHITPLALGINSKQPPAKTFTSVTGLIILKTGSTTKPVRSPSPTSRSQAIVEAAANPPSPPPPPPSFPLVPHDPPALRTPLLKSLRGIPGILSNPNY
ncbi:hypothetical protein B0J17DRAFT_770855 [Rhizoctonia solani]|nr:hypothetical protein B0J17DRAFT_770855 [Rhizoctonia solani]